LFQSQLHEILRRDWSSAVLGRASGADSTGQRNANRLHRVVEAYRDFKDEPGFTPVVPIEEIRAKDGNLSIPLYVGGGTKALTDSSAEITTTALPDPLSSWLESSRKVLKSLQTLGTLPSVK